MARCVSRKQPFFVRFRSCAWGRPPLFPSPGKRVAVCFPGGGSLLPSSSHQNKRFIKPLFYKTLLSKERRVTTTTFCRPAPPPPPPHPTHLLWPPARVNTLALGKGQKPCPGRRGLRRAGGGLQRAGQRPAHPEPSCAFQASDPAPTSLARTKRNSPSQEGPFESAFSLGLAPVLPQEKKLLDGLVQGWEQPQSAWHPLKPFLQVLEQKL